MFGFSAVSWPLPGLHIVSNPGCDFSWTQSRGMVVGVAVQWAEDGIAAF